MDPLIVRWDRTVIHPDPNQPDDPTIVCCLTEAGQPVALFLDDELREALGLMLVEPDPTSDGRQPTQIASTKRAAIRPTAISHPCRPASPCLSCPP